MCHLTNQSDSIFMDNLKEILLNRWVTFSNKLYDLYSGTFLKLSAFIAAGSLSFVKLQKGTFTFIAVFCFCCFLDQLWVAFHCLVVLSRFGNDCHLWPKWFIEEIVQLSVEQQWGRENLIVAVKRTEQLKSPTKARGENSNKKWNFIETRGS